MLTSFADELQKIAANTVLSTSPTTPAPVSTGTKPKSSLNPETKTTSYSTINTQPPPANFDVAAGAKSLPPPPVRT